ncbi:MAG: DNA-methyltransferase [Solirubrobacteraceae bacterium]
MLRQRFHAQQPLYSTPLGSAFCGDSVDWLMDFPDASIDLALTSPPFPLLRQKAYGNKTEDDYLEWLLRFGRVLKAKLKPTASFVVDLGGAYQRGAPIRSLVQWKFVIRMVEDLGYYLAQECYWNNPSKLPSPFEWVNKRKLRLKDPVNTVWWFGQTAWPKADTTRVLVPYSDRMQKLLLNPEAYYTAADRPSQHYVSWNFKDNGGALPSHLLTIPNSESNGTYLRACKVARAKPHPARFPEGLPEFFIKLLTDPDDLVVDLFAGSNTTGAVAEKLGRRWMACDLDRSYVAASALRFVQDLSRCASIYERLMSGDSFDLMEPTARQAG